MDIYRHWVSMGVVETIKDSGTPVEDASASKISISLQEIKDLMLYSHIL